MAEPGNREVRGRSFPDEANIETDGARFVDCTFGVTLFIYGGGGHPVFENCTFGEVGWRFTGAALRTIQFLQVIRASKDGEEFINDVFRPGNWISE